MRILFFGTAEFAVPSLEAVTAPRYQVMACVTQPDRPQGRGQEVHPSPVRQAALRLGLRVEAPTDLRGAAQALEALHPDVGVVVSYGRLIPPELLGVPRHGLHRRGRDRNRSPLPGPAR